MKRGFAGIMSFVVAFVLLVLMALFVNVYTSYIGVSDLVGESAQEKLEFSIEYRLESVKRFQGCDVTLLTLLQTKVDGSEYTFAEAIAQGEDVEEAAEELLSQIYDEEVGLCFENCIDQQKYCSQYIPLLDGTPKKVVLFEK